MLVKGLRCYTLLAGFSSGLRSESKHSESCSDPTSSILGEPEKKRERDPLEAQCLWAIWSSCISAASAGRNVENPVQPGYYPPFQPAEAPGSWTVSRFYKQLAPNGAFTHDITFISHLGLYLFLRDRKIW